MKKRYSTFTSNKTAFSLTEMVIALVAFSVIFATFPVLFKNFVLLKESSKNKKIDDIYHLYNDLTYSSSIAKSISLLSQDEVMIKRYDDCIIYFYYDEDRKMIKKRAQCPQSEPKENSLVVANIEKASFLDNGDGTFVLKFKKEKEKNIEHKFIFGGLE